MDADMARQLLPRWRIGATWREALARKESRLLAEFLSRGETASQDPNTEVEIEANLSHDLLCQILMLLPAESLLRLRFVCKQWFGLINSSIFVASHAQKSETVLISQQMALCPRGCVGKPRAYFHFLSLDGLRSSFVESSVDELCSVRASYDGLTVMTNLRRKRLVLTNPMTGEYVDLPLGVSCNHPYDSFGIAFCSEAKTYKVVPLFPEPFGSVGCEILNIGTRKWRRVKGSLESVRIGQTMLSVGGSLHLLGVGDWCDYVVSLDARDEKVVTKNLPVKRVWNDAVVEMGGDLGFVSHAKVDALEVWILSEECWIKRCRIDSRGDLVHCVPVCSRRDGSEMVRECEGGLLFVYDFARDETRLISSGSSGYDDDDDDDDDDDEPWFVMMNKIYIPHRNTLVSWGDQRTII